METDLHGNGLGRDTMVCGDPMTWFLMKRVIFCPAIRRMHDKTQVIPLTRGDKWKNQYE